MERKDPREVDVDDIDDPRTYDEIECENLDLKEQLLHQMLTAEQYLAVAHVWLAN